jgi:hypothetical protein
LAPSARHAQRRQESKSGIYDRYDALEIYPNARMFHVRLVTRDAPIDIAGSPEITAIRIIVLKFGFPAESETTEAPLCHRSPLRRVFGPALNTGARNGMLYK